jgi:outer membrane receptor protein involved in Fe transport
MVLHLLKDGYQRAVRAPNVRELFEAPTTRTGGTGDPCAIRDIPAQNPQIVAACIRNGVPAELVGQDIVSFPVTSTRGNPGLAAERADTWTVGGVLTLGGRTGLTLSLDYYDISIDGAIGPFGGGGDFVVFACIAGGGDPADPLCRSFSRGAGGAIVTLDAGTANSGRLIARGIDWQADAHIEFGSDGAGSGHRLEVRLAGTHYLQNGFRLNQSVPFVGCAGQFGGACGNTIGGTATPEWKLYNNLTWTAGGASLNLRHRWFSATEDYRNGFRGAFGLPLARLPEEGRVLEARHYVDVSASFRIGDAHRFTLGVANLFDEKPPVTGFLQVQANTDPSLYEVLGRRWFLSLSVAVP